VIRFTLAGLNGTDATSGTVTVKNITDSVTLDSFTTYIGDIVEGTNGYTLTCDFSTASLQVGAGESKIVSLEVDTTDFAEEFENIKATISNAAADLNWSDVDSDNISESNSYFTWLPLVGNKLVVQ
jgi:hypothetical protein